MSVTRWIAAVLGLVLLQSVTTNITGQTPTEQQRVLDARGEFWILGAGTSDCGELTN
jgi:hypothetical protein